MESSASKCNRALPSAIEPICFGAQLRERYTLKSDIYQLSVLIAGPFLPNKTSVCQTKSEYLPNYLRFPKEFVKLFGIQHD